MIPNSRVHHTQKSEQLPPDYADGFFDRLTRACRNGLRYCATRANIPHRGVLYRVHLAELTP